MSLKAPAAALRTHVESGVEFLRIEHPDRMDPFLMTLASDSDCWAYICSSGGMTAGRVDPDGALFPYETVDRLLQSHRTTGPITLLRAGSTVWEPFTADVLAPGVERALDKSVLGHQLMFTETNRELGLRVRARWASCDRFGHVRSVTLENLSTEDRRVEVLDGFRGLLPFGAELGLYQARSCLVDAYKQVDLDAPTRLATIALTSRVIDRPQAAEMLRANVVWPVGLEGAEVHLRPETPLRFRQGRSLEPLGRLEGKPAGYFLRHEIRLGAGESRRWHLVADVACDHHRLASLRSTLAETRDLEGNLESALRASGETLAALLASADGFQCTAAAVEDDHHTANVLFNIMRGGVFWRGHLVPRDDFLRFVEARHRRVHASHAEWIESLRPEVEVRELLQSSRAREDASLERITLEYLPLYFGRRHGDPSRPWNLFRIRVRESDGSPALDYQGNWRDIFQNWEALAQSFPDFLPGMIAKFVNASTVDGFNPYRITRDGIDWEVEDPDDPWSFIGYWGDHQIIYLLKLVETLSRFDPEGFETMLSRRVYATARVPYRLRDYESIARDPHHTIDFDHDAERDVAEKVERWGADGRLLLDAEGEAVHVNLYEKLLIPALSKLSNLVADAGIWMNTQRPEWNDANNALVGNGVSMVTLCYLRRYLDHLRPVFGRAERIEVSSQVCVWLDEVRGVLERFREVLTKGQIDDGTRRALLDALGGAFERYRRQAYDVAERRFETIEGTSITDLFGLASEYLDHAIAANWREDGLLHSYNLLRLSEGRAQIDRLPVMLEGQVAALSSGAVGGEQAVRMVEALFSSPLYRADQRSFLLYPATTLPSFFDRNRVETARAEAIGLVKELQRAGDTSIVARDAGGHYRFHGDFADAQDLGRALDTLEREERWSALVLADRDALLELFEQTFHHHAFTGRSGTMYGYEGLGCIYWHMISKLLLAIQEIALARADERRVDDTFHDLARAYYRVREGLGFSKTPAEFGAFPTDPYSHTPAHAGAQQPGMTGQVKEEILTRFGELGVRMEDGRLAFRPSLLRREEFRVSPGRFEGVDPAGAPVRLDVAPGGLAFSVAQVPVVYRLDTARRWVRVHTPDGGAQEFEGSRLDLRSTRALLGRERAIERVEVGILASDLLTLDR